MTKKKASARFLFYRNQGEKHFVFFFCLALHVLGQLQINQTNPFEALFNVYKHLVYITNKLIVISLSPE